MYKKKSLALGILILFSSTGAQALTEQAAWVAGTLAAIPATFISSNYDTKVAIFALSELLMVNLFLSYTPKNRYSWATKKFDSAKLDPLFMATMEQETLPLLLQEAGCESSEVPLVSVFLRLQHYDMQLVYMQEELQKALSDLDLSSELAAKINDQISAIKPHLARVRANEAFIKNQKNWLEQWKLHQERLLAKEKLDHYDRLQTHIVWNVRNY